MTSAMKAVRYPFSEDARPVVAMVRAPVFNASETFVRAQMTGLVRYQALVVGLEDKGNVPAELEQRLLLSKRWETALGVRLFGLWGALGRRIEPIAPALVHAQFGTDGVLAMPLARQLGVPLVTTLRGYEVTRRHRDLLTSARLSWMRYALLERRLASRGDLFLTVSDALREKALARGYPPDRTFTHYNGVDLGRFRPSGGARENIVLHIGRLVEKKGTALLLRAFARVHEKFSEYELVIVGDGPLRSALEKLAGELGLGDAVRFEGHQPAATVARWLQRAALLAAPSLTAASGDSEGLPNVVVEAASSGLPVLASDHAGIPEAVVDGLNGFVVPEHDVERLSHGLAELLASPELRDRFGRAGRHLAEQRFDGERQMRLLEERYDSLLATRSPSTRSSAIETR